MWKNQSLSLNGRLQIKHSVLSPYEKALFFQDFDNKRKLNRILTFFVHTFEVAEDLIFICVKASALSLKNLKWA